MEFIISLAARFRVLMHRIIPCSGWGVHARLPLPTPEVLLDNASGLRIALVKLGRWRSRIAISTDAGQLGYAENMNVFARQGVAMLSIEMRVDLDRLESGVLG